MAPPRTYFFFGLNAVRCLSIISLLLVFASGIFVMVTNIKAVNAFQANLQNSNGTTQAELMDCDYIEGSTVPHQPAGVFWAVVSSLLVIFQVVILLLSECSWPMSFFDRFFPVLGSNFGLGALGIFQCFLGAQILSHHVDDFTLVSAFLLFSIGCLNMLLGLIFRESAKQRRSIRAWRSDSKPILPTVASEKGISGPVFVNASPAFGSTSGPQAAVSEFGVTASPSMKLKAEKAGYGFGRQGEKTAGLRGFILQKPDETLPRYATPTPRPAVSMPSPEPASPPGLPQQHRAQSIRSSSSSFASPEYARHDIESDDDDDDEDERRPHFKSSTTAI